jgi:hypothetical protein
MRERFADQPILLAALLAAGNRRASKRRRSDFEVLTEARIPVLVVAPLALRQASGLARTCISFRRYAEAETLLRDVLERRRRTGPSINATTAVGAARQDAQLPPGGGCSRCHVGTGEGSWTIRICCHRLSAFRLTAWALRRGRSLRGRSIGFDVCSVSVTTRRGPGQQPRLRTCQFRAA